eukprot:TRINITY_DN22313_c0_g1_i1.p1 TRINITY_DN22313_c0_g1~~TRINITY_DN22313_c0_g1_i1.p1  ORF type:complete len:672 (+),score=9.30 TRINITY_DN22313_c0_g1_i1:106-2121(+)
MPNSDVSNWPASECSRAESATRWRRQTQNAFGSSSVVTPSHVDYSASEDHASLAFPPPVPRDRTPSIFRSASQRSATMLVESVQGWDVRDTSVQTPFRRDESAPSSLKTPVRRSVSKPSQQVSASRPPSAYTPQAMFAPSSDVPRGVSVTTHPASSSAHVDPASTAEDVLSHCGDPPSPAVPAAAPSTKALWHRSLPSPRHESLVDRTPSAYATHAALTGVWGDAGRWQCLGDTSGCAKPPGGARGMQYFAPSGEEAVFGVAGPEAVTACGRGDDGCGVGIPKEVARPEAEALVPWQSGKKPMTRLRGMRTSLAYSGELTQEVTGSSARADSDEEAREEGGGGTWAAFRRKRPHMVLPLVPMRVLFGDGGVDTVVLPADADGAMCTGLERAAKRRRLADWAVQISADLGLPDEIFSAFINAQVQRGLRRGRAQVVHVRKDPVSVCLQAQVAGARYAVQQRVVLDVGGARPWLGQHLAAFCRAFGAYGNVRAYKTHAVPPPGLLRRAASRAMYDDLAMGGLTVIASHTRRSVSPRLPATPYMTSSYDRMQVRSWLPEAVDTTGLCREKLREVADTAHHDASKGGKHQGPVLGLLERVKVRAPRVGKRSMNARFEHQQAAAVRWMDGQPNRIRETECAACGVDLDGKRTTKGLIGHHSLCDLCTQIFKNGEMF